MPQKRAAIEGAKPAEECMLHIGKHNNVIKWKEQMQTIVTELYGIMGMFFSTNVRFDPPKTSYRDYPISSESEEESSESESDEEEAGAQPDTPEVAAAKAVAAAATRKMSLRKMSYTRREKRTADS